MTKRSRNQGSQNDLESAANSPLVGTLSRLLGNSPLARVIAVVLVVAGAYLITKFLPQTTNNVPGPVTTAIPTSAQNVPAGGAAGLPAVSFKQTAKQIT